MLFSDFMFLKFNEPCECFVLTCKNKLFLVSFRNRTKFSSNLETASTYIQAARISGIKVFESPRELNERVE